MNAAFTFQMIHWTFLNPFLHILFIFLDLKALILNNNCIQSVEGIEKLSSLNSLGRYNFVCSLLFNSQDPSFHKCHYCINFCVFQLSLMENVDLNNLIFKSFMKTTHWNYSMFKTSGSCAYRFLSVSKEFTKAQCHMPYLLK